MPVTFQNFVKTGKSYHINFLDIETDSSETDLVIIVFHVTILVPVNIKSCAAVTLRFSTP